MTDSELVAATMAGPGGKERPSTVGVATACNVDSGGGLARADLDDPLSALSVLVDALLPAGRGTGRRPTISSSELITLAVAQILPGCHSERGSRGSRASSLGICSPHPQQPGYNKRLRSLAPEIRRVIEHLVRIPSSFSDRRRLLDSTPVPPGSPRRPAKRSELAGWATYGHYASHSRQCWGLRLYLPCAPEGMPVSFCLAPANEPEREVAVALLERARRQGLPTGGEIIIGRLLVFPGAEFEQTVVSFDATLVRPDRRDEKPRFGKLGRIRRWIESINDTLKGQLSLENHVGLAPKASGRVASR